MARYAICPMCDGRAVKIDIGRLPHPKKCNTFYDTDIYSCTYCGSEFMRTKSTRRLHSQESHRPFQLVYKDKIEDMSFDEWDGQSDNGHII